MEIDPKNLDAAAATLTNLINAVDHPEVVGTPNTVLADWEILIPRQSPDPDPETGLFAATYFNRVTKHPLTNE
jgi:hypothetical protein